MRFLRFKSIVSLKPQLLSGETRITPSLINETIANNELADLKAIVTANKQLLTPSLQNQLADIIHHDYSVYYLLKDHQFNSSQLKSLIRSNPGRVDSSWDLYCRHGQDAGHDEVYVEVITKLMYGEKSDPASKVLEVDWAKVCYLYGLLANKELIKKEVFDKLMESQTTSFQYFQFDTEFLKTKLGELEGITYGLVFNQIYKDVNLETLAKGLELNYNFDFLANKEFIKEYQKLTNQTPSNFDITDVLQYINTNKLDIRAEPESLLVRMALIKIYGMKMDDFGKLLEKYHGYQTHSKFGIEIVQALVIQSYCYKCFNDKAPELLDVIEVLMLETVPIKVLQALILTHSQFDVDKSLQVYNKYIRHLSTTPNEVTGRSPAGLLHESLILAFLYNNDREFGQLIYDKVELRDDEKKILKALFKVYGASFADDTWESARPRLELYIRTMIRNL